MLPVRSLRRVLQISTPDHMTKNTTNIKVRELLPLLRPAKRKGSKDLFRIVLEATNGTSNPRIVIGASAFTDVLADNGEKSTDLIFVNELNTLLSSLTDGTITVYIEKRIQRWSGGYTAWKTVLNFSVNSAVFNDDVYDLVGDSISGS